MSRLGVICTGILCSLAMSDAAVAQLTIAPTAAAQRDAAITAPANSPAATTPAAPAGPQSSTPAPVQNCSLSWAKIEAFARGGTILEQGPNCYIFAGPNVFRR